MLIISDALPVQFWLITCDTYNEAEPCGMHYVCWYAPIECNDPITVQLTNTPGMDYKLRIIDEDDNIIDTITLLEDGVNGSKSVYHYTFTPSSLDICDVKIKLQILDGVSVVAKSDGLDVRTDHPCTRLIIYSNTRNYAGLIYGINDSPDVQFYLRVPARFYHERNMEEDDSMDLTSSVITTSSQIKTQRLLEVQHVPYYFHKKIQLVLKHQNLEIDTVTWKKQEAYEIIQGRQQWPLKAATCYLTDKNSLIRNTL